MSQICEICSKRPRSGNTVSHAHNVNKRVFRPNIREIKTTVNGTPKRIKICMKCLKAMSKD